MIGASIRNLHSGLSTLKRQTRLAAFGVILFSAYTTWYGFDAMFNVEAEPSILARMLPMVVAGTVHFVGMVGLDRWYAGYGRRYLLLWTPLAMVAIVLSAGFHWQHFFSDEVVSGDYRDRHSEAMQALVRIGDGYGYVGRSMDELATYSVQVAKEETEKGGTCGYPTPTGQGPRFQLRQADKDAFAQLAAEFRTRNEELQGLVHQAAALGAPSAADVQKTVDQLRAILDRAAGFGPTDPVVASLKAKLKARLELGGSDIPTGKTDAKGHPLTFRCPDARLASGITSALATIDALPALPRVAVEDARNLKIAVRIVIRRIFDSLGLGGWNISPPTRSGLEAQRKAQLRAGPVPSSGLQTGDYQAIAMASIVELLILGLYFLDVKRVTGGNDAGLRRLNRIWANTAGDAALADRIATTDISARSAARLIRDYAVRRFRKLQIFINADPRTDEQHRIGTLMDLLVEVGMAKYLGPVKGGLLDRIFGGLPAAWRNKFPAGTPLLQYTMSLHQHRVLVRHSLVSAMREARSVGSADGTVPRDDAEAADLGTPAADPQPLRLITYVQPQAAE